MKNKLFTSATCKAVVNKDEKIVHVIASTGVIDRHGESVNPQGWLLDNFKKNPVVLIAHDYRSLPIGKAVKVWVEDEKLQAYIQIADTQEGREVFYLIENGFLNTVSVGFIPTKYGVSGQDPYTIMEAELLEISFVAVPANPEALINNDVQSRFLFLEKSLDEAQYKGAVPFESYEKDESSSWDGDKARKQLAKWASSDGSGDKDKIDWGKYKKGFGWFDEKDKENFGSYKLPHHYVKDGKLVTVWSGLKAAMGALLGARGGTNIPAEDRKGVYNHLAKHYKEFEKEAPEFKEYTNEELFELDQKGLIDCGEVLEINKEYLAKIKKEADEIRNLKKTIKSILEEMFLKYKVVEEKVVEKIIRVKDDELSEDAVKLLYKMRKEMRKSDKYTGLSLKILNSLLKVSSSEGKGGEK